MDVSERTRWLNVHCPDGGLLQSDEWRTFKTREGFATEHFEGNEFSANVVEHTLPLAGKYWYVPRGPVIEQLAINYQSSADNRQSPDAKDWRNIIDVAKKKRIGWIRIEPRSEEDLNLICEWSKGFFVKKAPHDMQPREVLVADIAGSEADVFARMKPKTRYNIRLAEKRGVDVISDRSEAALGEFLRMNRETAKRNHISTHPDQHYRMLLESFPSDKLELFIARHDGKVLAAILVAFFGDTATYLHGASSDDKRGFMAPYLLQWRAIEMARRRGCVRYDFGGVDTMGDALNLSGVTRFKQGFARNVNAIRYPGSYDIVLIPSRYWLYMATSLSKSFVIKAKIHLTKL